MLKIVRDSENAPTTHDGVAVPILQTSDGVTICCAFDKNSYCYPICAAFDKRGTKLYYQRNGTDNEFCIGEIND